MEYSLYIGMYWYTILDYVKFCILLISFYLEKIFSVLITHIKGDTVDSSS